MAGNPDLADGELVSVVGNDGRPLALGFWDARAPIAVRLLGDAQAAGVRDEIERRAAAALARRLAFIDRASTSAFRWIHGEADALPGVHVDVYGRAAAIRYDGDGARAFYLGFAGRLPALAGLVELPIDVVVERRARGDSAGAKPAFGFLPEGEIEVLENGLRFGVDLAHGQKGGLFLDQRDNRALVGGLASGRRVLNLYGYTGGFSIYAAAGGARATTTIDIAAPAIAAARRNFERNRLPLGNAELIAGDAFAFLDAAAKSATTFDLVISDPPSFAPSRRALPTGLRAYRRLHRMCAAVVAPGGVLCAASCSSHVTRDVFAATIRDGARDAGRRATIRALRGAAPDHPVAPNFPEGDYLKFAVVDL